MHQRSSRVAVLTGDLITSTAHPPDWTQQALDRIEACALAVRGWDNADDPHFTRFRGDGWQIVLSEPRRALRAALYIIATLKAVDSGAQTRVAVGLGDMNPWQGADLSSASGSAFVASGQALDRMEDDRRLAVVAPESAHLHNALAGLLNDQLEGWSREQAEAMAHFLPPASPTLKELATAIGISPQAVHARLKSAHWRAVLQAVSHWEAHEEARDD